MWKSHNLIPFPHSVSHCVIHTNGLSVQVIMFAGLPRVCSRRHRHQTANFDVNALLHIRPNLEIDLSKILYVMFNVENLIPPPPSVSDCIIRMNGLSVRLFMFAGLPRVCSHRLRQTAANFRVNTLMHIRPNLEIDLET